MPIHLIGQALDLLVSAFRQFPAFRLRDACRKMGVLRIDPYGLLIQRQFPLTVKLLIDVTGHPSIMPRRGVLVNVTMNPLRDGRATFPRIEPPINWR
jgi:hypothetical protein